MKIPARLLVPVALFFAFLLALAACAQSTKDCAAPDVECDLDEISSNEACDEGEDESTCRVISVEQCDETYTTYCRPDPNSIPDPCNGEDLPDCPAECPVDDPVQCGNPCDTEGEACGNALGDGRVCTDGAWICSVHAPLSDDDTVCNHVCKPVADPCDELELPPCPEECPAEDTVECGSACENDGEECGNEIGDGRNCVDGLWQCSVHPPLGDGCNQVCRKPIL
jgi:hypothetical protein